MLTASPKQIHALKKSLADRRQDELEKQRQASDAVVNRVNDIANDFFKDLDTLKQSPRFGEMAEAMLKLVNKANETLALQRQIADLQAKMFERDQAGIERLARRSRRFF